MNRRWARSWARWLLPWLALRAFVPVGFMLAADADGLSLAFCSAQMPPSVQLSGAAAPVDHAVHSAAGASHTDRGAEHEAHESAFSACAFALAAVAVTAEVPPLGADALPPAAEPTLCRPVHLGGAAATRVLSIRGPPARS